MNTHSSSKQLLALTSLCAIFATACTAPVNDELDLEDDVELEDTEETAEAESALAATIPHDQVVGFAENIGDWAKAYKPSLKVEGGCVPFPAVQADGKWSGGLESTGSANGGCTSSIGQIYARAMTYNNHCALMYSWFFPKDGNPWSGHRYDWEEIVVWLDNPTCHLNTGVPRGVSVSGHGAYSKNKTGNGYLGYNANGRSPKIKYYQPGVYNFQLHTTGHSGSTHAAIAWANLTAEARTTLNTANFGKANVPFNDTNFANKVAQSYDAGYFN